MICVRRATRSDSSGLINVAKTWPTENGSIVVSLDDEGAVDLAAEARHLDDETYCVLVAMSGEHIIGYAAGQLDSTGRIASLDELMVAEEQQRRGIGTLLVGAFEEWARERICEMVRLGGGPAPGFYEKIGYKRAQAFHYVKRL